MSYQPQGHILWMQKRNAWRASAVMPRMHLAPIACMSVVMAFLLLYVQTVAAQSGSDTTTAFTPQKDTTDLEENQHVLRLVLIVFPVMLMVWLALSGVFAYVFITVCPNLYTK